MAFGMFSSNPFEAFERGYGYETFSPWTTSFNRPRFIRPQSARRFVNPVAAPFMWDIPREMAVDDNCEDYPFRRRQCAPRRSARSKKTKPKSPPNKIPQARREPTFDEAPYANNEQSLKKKNSSSNDGHNLKSPEQQLSNLRVRDSDEDETNTQEPSNEKVSKNEDSDYESAHEPEDSEPVQQIQVDCVDIHENETENCSKSEHQPEMKAPEACCDHEDIPEVKAPEANCNQDELPVRVDDSEENNECKNEKSNDEENAVKNETDKRLEEIEMQHNKAKQLISGYDLSDLKLTDKQRLYLTEMLLRCILDLDKIEVQGNETVKQRRRKAVQEIQTYLDQVENTMS